MSVSRFTPGSEKMGVRQFSEPYQAIGYGARRMLIFTFRKSSRNKVIIKNNGFGFVLLFCIVMATQTKWQNYGKESQEEKLTCHIYNLFFQMR